MVSPELEMVALHHDPKMSDGQEGFKQFPVESRVFVLCSDSFLEKKPSGHHAPASRCWRTLLM